MHGHFAFTITCGQKLVAGGQFAVILRRSLATGEGHRGYRVRWPASAGPARETRYPPAAAEARALVPCRRRSGPLMRNNRHTGYAIWRDFLKLTARQSAVLAALRRRGDCTMADLRIAFPYLALTKLEQVISALESEGLVERVGGPGRGSGGSVVFRPVPGGWLFTILDDRFADYGVGQSCPSIPSRPGTRQRAGYAAAPTVSRSRPRGPPATKSSSIGQARQALRAALRGSR